VTFYQSIKPENGCKVEVKYNFAHNTSENFQKPDVKTAGAEIALNCTALACVLSSHV
jgi:hypothetical protein